MGYVVEPGLEEVHARILRDGRRHSSPDAGAGTVGADDTSIAGLAQTVVRMSGIDDQAAVLTASLAVEGYLVAAQDDQPDRVPKMLFQILR